MVPSETLFVIAGCFPARAAVRPVTLLMGGAGSTIQAPSVALPGKTSRATVEFTKATLLG